MHCAKCLLVSCSARLISTSRRPLWVDNTPPNNEINWLRRYLQHRPAPRYVMLKPWGHGPVPPRPPRCTPRLLPGTSRCRPGNFGPPPATRRSQTAAPAATPERRRPALLDHPPPNLG